MGGTLVKAFAQTSMRSFSTPQGNRSKKKEKSLAATATISRSKANEKPVEVFQWENKTKSSQEVELAINHCSGNRATTEASETLTPRLKFALLENGGGVSETQYPASSEGDTVGPTIFGHSGAASAITVGAERFDDNSAPEEYSSRGPVTHYFGPTRALRPPPNSSAPETVSKPDLVATDCGVTTFFASLKKASGGTAGPRPPPRMPPGLRL